MIRPLRLAAFVVMVLGIAASLPATAADTLSARLASAVAAKQSKSVRVSVGVWDAKSGETLHETNGATLRRPASVMKIATTAAAMLELGPSAALVTEVFATSEPDSDGVVAGDLVVRGSGDPGINNRAGPGAAEALLRDLAKSVRAKGVKRVTGNLVLDDTAFTGAARHPGWEWGDGDWSWYKAPVGSLLLTDACIDLTVAPGASEGAAAVLRSDPPTQAVRLVNRVSTAPSAQKRTNVALGRSDGAGSVPVTGTVPAGSAGYSVSSACVDPAEHFGDVFARVLREQGVAVAGRPVVVRSPGGVAGPRIVSADPAALVKLARHATPVIDVVRIANKHSQNLYAEVLLRAVGRSAGFDGSFDGGCRGVRQVLGFAPGDTTFTQVDGSGLARENQVTVGAIGRILVKMYGSPLGRDFVASLATPGEAGSTLRDRLEGKKYENRIYAKTGTLRDTKSLAGYVRSQSGRTFAFAVLCEGENSRARDLQDDVVDALIEQ